MHYHMIEDDTGDLVDIVHFCSDACHRQWCEDNDEKYGGWNGCNEGSDSVEFCDNCGVVAGGTYECDCQRDNVVVNLFLSEEGEKCEHEHWLQVPACFLTSR